MKYNTAWDELLKCADLRQKHTSWSADCFYCQDYCILFKKFLLPTKWTWVGNRKEIALASNKKSK